MPRKLPVIAKKTRKKKSECSEHVKLMKTLKGRLIDISLKVDNYIYKQKPITKLQAKAFLNEITSFKSQCQNDGGYLQVIEKLTKFMNIIISNDTPKTSVNDIYSNVKVIEAPNNSTLSNTNENLEAPVDIESENTNQDNTQNQTNEQNNLELTLYNETGSEATVKDTYENNKQCYKKVDKGDIINESVDLDKGGVTNIPSKVLANDSHVDSSNETDLSQTASVIQGGAGCKDDDKATTSKNQTSAIVNKVENSLKNNNRLLICVDGGVIHDIKHLSNASVVHQAPEVHIPLSEFVLNNTKTPITSSNTQSEVIQDKLGINSGEETNVTVIKKPRRKKTNNKNVKFTAPYINLTENVRPNNKSDDVNNTNKFITYFSNNSEVSIFLKERTENEETKNKNRNKIKECRSIDAEKTKRPKIKRKVNKINNISYDSGIDDKKSQVPAIKRKIKKRQNIKSILAKEKSSNELKAQNDLAWFDSIKYVRKIDEREYFKPVQPLDANFWCDPGSILGDEREFTM